MKECSSSKVPTTFTITYKGSKYSVPPEYIGKTVLYYAEDNVLYIYYNGNLIAEHTISSQKINYKREHYSQALKEHGYKDDQIESMVERNFERFKGMGL